MIEIKEGDILKANAEALVNTVNCVGVMGRGIALQFKKKFPQNFNAYKTLCNKNEMKPGRVFVFDLERIYYPRYIINFPTKKHWKANSRLEYIEAGLESLVKEIRNRRISSIAVPPLGCGLGGLDWNVVRPIIEKAFSQLPEVQVLLFEPKGAPDAEKMVKVSTIPRMTVGRAALIMLIRRYLAALMDPDISLLEIHKLMYFLQEAGQPLRLNYEKGTYGPYAQKLRHVLNVIEGHFIEGYGDAEDRPDIQIHLKGNAVVQAQEYLEKHRDTLNMLERVFDLISGFETPFGMELISTVHWVVTRENSVDLEDTITKVYQWNQHKKIFRENQIKSAWECLEAKNWIPSPN
jgi:O-acetyl-ADP-ribose deacetylase (regulator of RNase III)/uncharacterized protein YwgA